MITAHEIKPRGWVRPLLLSGGSTQRRGHTKVYRGWNVVSANLLRKGLGAYLTQEQVEEALSFCQT